MSDNITPTTHHPALVRPRTRLAGSFEEAMQPLLASLDKLEVDADELQILRATLIVNFGDKQGRAMRIVDEKAGTTSMLCDVLKHLLDYVPEERNMLKCRHDKVPGTDTCCKCGQRVSDKSTKKPQRLIRDDDGHWYMIDCDQVENFRKWSTAMAVFEPSEFDFARSIVNGPHAVEILEWRHA